MSQSQYEQSDEQLLPGYTLAGEDDNDSLEDEAIEPEKEDVGGGNDELSDLPPLEDDEAPEKAPEREPVEQQPASEPEAQQPQVDPEVVAQWLKSQGYKVDKEEVEQAGEEIPDPMLDPQAYAEYVQEKALEATAPLLKPMLVKQAIDGIQARFSKLGITLPDDVVATMQQDASAAKLTELQALVSDPVRLLATGAYYVEQAGVKPIQAPAAPTKPVVSPSEIPVATTPSKSSVIPKDQVPYYRAYLKQFGLKDSAQVRKEFLEG